MVVYCVNRDLVEHLVDMLAKKESRSSTTSRFLDKKDAKEFRIAAKKYVAANTASKSAARKKLVTLGILTPTGRLTKKYG